jgi:CheY-like chemotaxis protein
MLPKVDVLVVDDAPDAAQSLALLLEQDGYAARFALSSEEALVAIERYKPLCVMLDIQMPGMDGLELAKYIRTKFQDDVVLIAFTGLDIAHPRVAETFDLVDHYFTKPLSPSEISKIFPRKAITV